MWHSVEAAAIGSFLLNVEKASLHVMLETQMFFSTPCGVIVYKLETEMLFFHTMWCDRL